MDALRPGFRRARGSSAHVLPSHRDAQNSAPTTKSPLGSTGKALTQTTTADHAAQSSITGTFANTTQSETTVVAGVVTLPYSKATFSNLETITAIVDHSPEKATIPCPR